MAALVAVERNFWLSLSEIKEKDRAFLLDALISVSGFFGGALKQGYREVSGGQETGSSI